MDLHQPIGLFAGGEIPRIRYPFPGDNTASTAYPSVMRSYEQYDATESRSLPCSPPHRPLASRALHRALRIVAHRMSSRRACGSTSTTGSTACCAAQTMCRRPSAFPISSAPASRWSSRMRVHLRAFSSFSGPNWSFARPKHRAAANRCGGTSTSCCWICNVRPLTGTPTPSSSSTS